MGSSVLQVFRAITKQIHEREVSPFPAHKTYTDYARQIALPGIDASKVYLACNMDTSSEYCLEIWLSLVSLVYPDVELPHQGDDSIWMFHTNKSSAKHPELACIRIDRPPEHHVVHIPLTFRFRLLAQQQWSKSLLQAPVHLFLLLKGFKGHDAYAQCLWWLSRVLLVSVAIFDWEDTPSPRHGRACRGSPLVVDVRIFNQVLSSCQFPQLVTVAI